MTLTSYLISCGAADSFRAAERLINTGAITINGASYTNTTVLVLKGDRITVGARRKFVV